MGHVANPLPLRLGWALFWQSIWYAKFDYPFIDMDTTLQRLLETYFRRKRVLATGVIFSHYVLVRKLRRNLCELFVFDPNFKEINKSYFSKTFKQRYRQIRRRSSLMPIKKNKIVAFNALLQPNKEVFSADFLVNRADIFPLLTSLHGSNYSYKARKFTRIIERPIRNFRRKIIGKRVFFHHDWKEKKTEILYYLGSQKKKKRPSVF